ncbi:MAG: hypothetical protein ACI4I9_01705 [Porcipelethomonas sp.]
MIDVENMIFNETAVRLRNRFPGIFVVGEAVNTVSAAFPAVSLVQKSNITDPSGRDSGSPENFADIMFEADVYTNDERGKKQNAKSIAAFISDIMTDFGFIRTLCQPLDNLADSKIYRIKLRFTARVDKNGMFYAG